MFGLRYREGLLEEDVKLFHKIIKIQNQKMTEFHVNLFALILMENQYFFCILREEHFLYCRVYESL